MSTLFSLKPTKISKVITSSRTTCNFQSTKNRPIDHYSLHLPPGPHGVQTKSFVSRPQVTNIKPLSTFNRQPLLICSITRTFQAKLYEKELSLKKIIVLTKNVLCKKKVCGPSLPSWEEASLQGEEPWDLPHIPNAPGWWWWLGGWWWWWWWWYMFDCETW